MVVVWVWRMEVAVFLAFLVLAAFLVFGAATGLSPTIPFKGGRKRRKEGRTEGRKRRQSRTAKKDGNEGQKKG